MLTSDVVAKGDIEVRPSGLEACTNEASITVVEAVVTWDKDDLYSAHMRLTPYGRYPAFCR